MLIDVFKLLVWKCLEVVFGGEGGGGLCWGT